MPRLQALTASFKHQALQFFADPQWVIPNIIAPFILTLCALMLFRDVTGPVVLYAVLGGGMLGMWGSTLYSSGWSIESDRWLGTIESVLATPSPLIWIVAGRTIWNSLIGIVYAFFIFFIAEVAFQAPVSIANPLLFLPALFLTPLSLSALGMVFCSFFVLTRSGRVLTNGLEFPIYVGTGTMFPIALLPFWSHPLSLSLAPTWGIDAIRYTALADHDGAEFGFVGDVMVMVVLTGVYLALSIWLFGVMEKRARRDATFGRF